MKLSWAKIADVAICTLLLRFVMGWILANRQIARLVIKLLLISVFVLIVNKVNLPLSQALTAYVALPVAALLVLMFIPEIKRAYQVTNLDRFFSLPQPSQGDTVQALAHALLELAQKKRGALLVFPKSDDIKPLIYGGEEYDAKVTKSLVLSIFHPACPRHDGAMIVQGDRVIQVGAFLPLSTPANIREEWGTRHLAALGLTERSDAQVIVVSEERGEISIVRDGKLVKILPRTIESVSTAVSSIFESEKDARKTKRKRRRAIGLWAIAFLAACVSSIALSWINPSNAAPDMRIMVTRVPVSFVNVPENFYIVDHSALSCRVYLRFPSNENESLASGLSLSIDLKNYPMGRSTVTLTQKMLTNLPPNWEAVGYDPQELKITLAQARNMSLPIEAKFTGLAKGLKVDSTSITPPDVDVRVEDEKTTKDRKIETTFINLSLIDKPGEYTFKTLVEFPASIKPLKGKGDHEVTVTVKIRKAVLGF